MSHLNRANPRPGALIRRQEFRKYTCGLQPMASSNRGNGGNHDPDHDHDNDNGHGNSDHDHDAPCYCRGTLIMTERGQIRIEDLAIGDMVVTISGEAFDGGLSDEEVETH